MNDITDLTDLVIHSQTNWLLYVPIGLGTDTGYLIGLKYFSAKVWLILEQTFTLFCQRINVLVTMSK